MRRQAGNGEGRDTGDPRGPSPEEAGLRGDLGDPLLEPVAQGREPCVFGVSPSERGPESGGESGDCRNILGAGAAAEFLSAAAQERFRYVEIILRRGKRPDPHGTAQLM